MGLISGPGTLHAMGTAKKNNDQKMGEKVELSVAYFPQERNYFLSITVGQIEQVLE